MRKQISTPLTARHLTEIATDLEWTHARLAEKSGIERTVVTNHLSGERPIRDTHIAAYISAVPGIDKLRLLIVWIRDVFETDDLTYLLGADDAKLKEEAATWLPALADDQRHAVQWLSGEMIKDRELNEWLLSLIRRLGYKPENNS